jgi:protease PrsW
MIPTFFIILVVIALALRREGQIVRDYLVVDFQGGLFTPEEYKRLCSIFGRMGLSFNALTRGGFGQWKTARQLNQTASELAFHRCRVARGITATDAMQREAAYQMALADLLKRLRSK